VPWQAADQGTLARDAQGNFHVKGPDGAWVQAPPGSVAKDDQGVFHFNSDALTAPPPAAAPKPQEAGMPGAGDILKGVGDAALSGAAKVSTGIVGAPVALANRLIAALSGGDPQMAADAAHEYINRTFGYDTQTPVGKHIGAAVQSVLAPLGESAHADEQLLEKGGEKIGIPAGETHGALSEAGDIAGTAGLAAPVLEGAQASTEAAAQAAQNAATGAAGVGLRTAEGHPIARSVAGTSGREALALQNRQVANTVAGAQAGVPHGTPLSYEALEAGRAAPGTVYDRVEAGLPTAPLSPAAADQVRAAGTSANVLTQPSDATAATIEAQKAKLLAGPLTGPQVVQTSRALRQEGGARIASDDVEQQNLGHAQLGMARALEQHIADTIPPNSPVSLEQFQAARTALAKNYAVQSALRGADVDLPTLARLQRADPGVMTDDLRTLADFANNNSEVSKPSPTARYNPPSMSKDLGGVSITHPMTWVRPLAGGIARRVLTGDPEAAMAAARGAPVAGLGGEFEPLPPGQLQLRPPEGQAPGPTQPELPLGPPMAPPHVDDVSVGEGARGTPGTRRGGATGLGTEFAPSGLNVGEGAAGTPGTRPGGATGLGTELGDLFGLRVGEGKGPKKRK
jgi:hypothetical protein